MKKRIAYLGHGMYYGGATTSLYLLIKSVDNAAFDKFLYIPTCRSEEMKNDFLKHCHKIQLVNIKQTHNNVVGGSSYWKCIVKSLLPSNKRFVDILKKENIDILHINTTVFPQIPGWVKKKSSIKVVTHLREQIPKYGAGFVQRYMIKQLYKYSDALIAISDNEAKPFIGHTNLHVLPNPFDFSKINKIQGTFRAIQGIPRESVIIGMMGQFMINKGHLDFLQALKILIQRAATKYPFVFVLMGVGSRENDLNNKNRQADNAYEILVNKYIVINKLSAYVKLLPYSYRIFEILKDIDIIVRPSLHGDPWGRDIIESMAFAKPIVATGTSEFFIQDGKTGFLVAPKDPENMALKIEDLINKKEKRLLFGSEGKARIQKMCDFETYGKKMVEIYNSCS